MPEIKVFQDGDQWCALLGVNLQEGECFFADTPEEAENGLRQKLAGQALDISPR